MASIFYGWWILSACFLIAFYVGGTVIFGCTAFFDPVVEEFGWGYTQISLAFSFRSLEMGIAPITGFLVDRFGVGWLAFFGTLTVGLALILLGLTNSLGMFYGAFFLLGLGAGGCAGTVLMTAAAHWFRKNVGKAMGILTCGFGAGGIVIPVIVWLIDVYGWRTALIILGLGMWALGTPLSFVIRHKPEHYGYLPDGEITTGSPSSDGDGDGKERTFKEVLKRGNFWSIAVADAMRSMITVAIVTHVMPYLSSIGMPRGSAAFVATSIPLFSIIGRFGFGWLSDIFDKRYVLVGLYCLLGMGTLAFAHISATWLMFPFLLLFSLAYGGTASIRGAIVREYFGRDSFGSLIGMIMGMAAIGGILGPSIAGWSFDMMGSYHSVWLWFAAATIIAIVLILRLSPSDEEEYKSA